MLSECNGTVVSLNVPLLLFLVYASSKGSCKTVHLHRIVLAFGCVLIDYLLTVKAATLIFISGRGSAISSAK